MENNLLYDCTSVETFKNVSALFVPKTSEVFREGMLYETRLTPDGKEYVSWGSDDQLPYKLINYIESDETLSTCQVFNAEVCYGAGLRYCVTDATKAVKREVEDFLLDNPLSDYFLGVCQDLKHFNFAVSVIILNEDGTKIVELHRKPACYCRFSPADPKTGRISKVIFGQFRTEHPQETFEEIELLDPRSPWKDLQVRMGRRASRTGSTPTDSRKFAILTRFPGVDSPYYPIPHYAALFRGSWYSIKRLIGEAKLAKLKNSAPIKYIVEVSSRYWERVYKEKGATTPAKQQEVMLQRKKEMMEFFTNPENAGNVLFASKSISLDGKGETSDVSITSVDSKTKEGGDWESDIAEAVNMVCFTMRVHSNLVGSVPGKAQNNNSGSDKRELYTIAQALQKPYHDLLFVPHDIIIRYNKWNGVHPDCPFIQLTTLDEHADAKQVTLNPNKNESNQS